MKTYLEPTPEFPWYSYCCLVCLLALGLHHAFNNTFPCGDYFCLWTTFVCSDWLLYLIRCMCSGESSANFVCPPWLRVEYVTINYCVEDRCRCCRLEELKVLTQCAVSFFTVAVDGGTPSGFIFNEWVPSLWRDVCCDCTLLSRERSMQNKFNRIGTR